MIGLAVSGVIMTPPNICNIWIIKTNDNQPVIVGFLFVL